MPFEGDMMNDVDCIAFSRHITGISVFRLVLNNKSPVETSLNELLCRLSVFLYRENNSRLDQEVT